MPQTSPCKLEYILNPIYRSKDKDIKNANKLNTIQEWNKTPTNTQKHTHTHTDSQTHTIAPYNVHDPEFVVEVHDKSTSGKWY